MTDHPHQKFLDDAFDYIISLEPDYRGALANLAEIPVSGNPLSVQANALRHVVNFLIILQDIGYSAGQPDQLRTLQVQFIDMLTNIQNITWLVSPDTDRDKAVVGRLVEEAGKTYVRLKNKGHYTFLLNFIQSLRAAIPNPAFELYAVDADKIWEDYLPSISLNLDQIELIRREHEGQNQIDRTRRLLTATPDSEEIKGLFDEAVKGYKKARGDVDKEVGKYRKALSQAAADRDWGDMRYFANIILGFRPEDQEAKAAKAEADEFRSRLAEASRQTKELLPLIGQAKFDAAQDSLEQILEPFPREAADSLLRVLETLEQYLVKFRVNWQEIEQFEDAKRFPEAIEKTDQAIERTKQEIVQLDEEIQQAKGSSQTIGDHVSVEEEKSYRNSVYYLEYLTLYKGYLVEFLNQLQNKQRDLQEAQSKAQAELEADQKIFAKLTNAYQKAGDLQAWRSVQVRIERALKGLKTEQQKENLHDLLQSVKERQDEELLTQLNKRLQDSTTHSDFLQLQNEIQTHIQDKLQTETGKEVLKAIEAEIARELRLRKASAQDIVVDVRRALEDGRLGAADRSLKSLSKKAIDDPDLQDNLRNLRAQLASQQSNLRSIRELAEGPSAGLQQIRDFIALHPNHREANQIYKELQFIELEAEWQAHYQCKDIQAGLDAARKALLLHPSRAEREKWRPRAQECERLLVQFSQAKADFEAGRIEEARNTFETLSSRSQKAEQHLGEIDILETRLRRAEQHFIDEKYSGAITNYEEIINEGIRLSEKHRSNYYRALYEENWQKGQEAFGRRDLGEAVKYLAKAVEFAPDKTKAEAAQASLRDARRTHNRIVDWETRTKVLIKDGEKLEDQHDFQSALEKYVVALSLEDDEIQPWLDRELKDNLTDAIDRVNALIDIKKRIIQAEKEVNTDDLIVAYEDWLKKKSDDQEATTKLKNLRQLKAHQNKLKQEFEFIESQLNTIDLQRIREAVQQLDQLRSTFTGMEDPRLVTQFRDLSRRVYDRHAIVAKYDGYMQAVDNALKRYDYETALQAIRSAHSVISTPEAESKEKQIANSKIKKGEVDSLIKQVQIAIDKEQWESARGLLQDVLSVNPEVTEQDQKVQELNTLVNTRILQENEVLNSARTIRQIMAQYDYQEADQQLKNARLRFGDRREFLLLQQDVENVRQTCIGLEDLLRQAAEQTRKRKYKRARQLYEEAARVENVEEIIKRRGLDGTGFYERETSSTQEDGFLKGILKGVLNMVFRDQPATKMPAAPIGQEQKIDE